MNFAALSVYGFGHFGKSLLWITSTLVFAFYLTEVASFAPAAMGWVLALSLVVNAAGDWCIGRLVGPHVSTAQAAAKLQLVGAGLAGLCFYLFAQTASVGPEHRTAYALVTLILFRLGYSLYDVPQNAILGLIAGTDSDRSQMAAARYAASGLATIAVTAFLAQWIVKIEERGSQSAFSLLAAVFAVISIGSALQLTIYFLRQSQHLAKASQSVPAIMLLRTEPSTPWLALGSIVIFSGLMPVFTELKVFYAAFALPNDDMAAAFLLSAALGQVLTQPVWAWIGRHRSLITLYRTAALALMIAGGAFGVLNSAAIHWVMVAAFLFGSTSSGLLMAIWSIMGSVAAADPQTALAKFGLFTFSSKLAQAGSILLIGQVLAAGDYRDGTATVVTLAMTAAVVATGALCLLLGGLALRFRSRT